MSSPTCPRAAAWVKLYKEVKWLNAFAIITDVAAQELMKDFDSLFFLEKDS